MKIITSVREMQNLSEKVRKEGKIIAFVPTMGFFHKGHLSLMEEGRKRGDLLVVSIFVNPTQFGRGEDYKEYPQDLEKDKKMTAEAGVDIIFAPSVKEMYPEDYQTYVKVERVTQNLCGISRPGHFKGVTTVVAKLFNVVKPHLALFGLKDFQQLVAIRQMVKDLNFDIEIVGMPIVREKDGLALSSRNVYLEPKERRAALSLNHSLKKAEEIFNKGEDKALKIVQEVKKIINSEDSTQIDYIKICDTKNLEDLEEINQEAVLALAVKIGKTRLIDNIILNPLERGKN